MVHRSAENVHFVRDFLKGSVKKESYIELLRALYHVYHAMETGLRELPEHLKHRDFSVLERSDALAADLAHGALPLPPLPAACIQPLGSSSSSKDTATHVEVNVQHRPTAAQLMNTEFEHGKSGEWPRIAPGSHCPAPTTTQLQDVGHADGHSESRTVSPVRANAFRSPSLRPRLK